MQRFDCVIFIVNLETNVAFLWLQVKSGSDPSVSPPPYFSGVERIAVVIERGSRICQRPASTRCMKSPQV